MKSRHRAREIALQILYQYDYSATPVKLRHQPLDITAHLIRHFEHFKTAPEMREFISQIVAGTLAEQQKIDAQLEQQSANWKLSRMSMIDRSILRMAAYELMSSLKTPPSVVINEAVKLAKQFGSEDSASFINGILDQLSKTQGKSKLTTKDDGASPNEDLKKSEGGKDDENE